MNIVVVGGGFGGVKAALELSKRHVGKITLISDEPYFLHHATLYATATGQDYAESVISLKAIFANHSNVTIIEDKIESIDPERRLLIGKHKQYPYDKAVLSLGSVTTYFGIKGMAQHSFGIKALQEIRQFQDHIHDEVVHQKLDKEYFVIGAGPTGVELAGALHEYLGALISVNRLHVPRPTVTLVEAAPRIVPRMSSTAARIITRRLQKMGIKVLVNQKCQALADNTITIGGKKHKTKTAIWTSGVANNPFFKEHAHLFRLAPNGRVDVDPHLQAIPNVYVIGDSNSVKYSGMAWPALHQATFVAKHLARLAAKRPTPPFHPRSVMTGLPVGHGWGYVEWLGLYIAGKSGYMTRRLMELYGYAQLVPLRTAITIWRAHDILEVRE